MAEGNVRSDDPFNETIATTGLFLIITAIISLAFALASWGQSEMLIAVVAGASSLVSFAASIACFKAQAAESVPAPGPSAASA